MDIQILATQNSRNSNQRVIYFDASRNVFYIDFGNGLALEYFNPFFEYDIKKMFMTFSKKDSDRNLIPTKKVEDNINKINENFKDFIENRIWEEKARLKLFIQDLEETLLAPAEKVETTAPLQV